MSIVKLILFLFLLSATHAAAQPIKDKWHIVYDTMNDNAGYANARGDTVISIGKYIHCFTDNFSRFAIVMSGDSGLVAINRQEQVLFHVYVFDNGPDYPSDGLFRITARGKIGYADLQGNVVIPPIYDCAYPFENGRAKVGKGCQLTTEGEHSSWTGGRWMVINKRGKMVKG